MAGILRLFEETPRESTEEPLAVPDFWMERGQGARFLRPFSVSVACHLAIFFGLPPIATWLPPEDKPVLVTVVHRPSRDFVLYLPVKPLVADRQRPVESPVGGDPGSGSGSGSGAEGQRKTGDPGRTVVSGRSVRGEGIILQPTPVIRPTRQMPEIPSLAVWTGPTPPAAPVEIGAPEPAKESRPPSAKPMIAPPVQQAEIKTMPLPELRVRTRGPVLPSANAAPMAVSADPLPAPPTMPGRQIRGSAAAILAVTPITPKSGEKLIVPPDVSVVGGGAAIPQTSASTPGLPGMMNSGQTETRGGTGAAGTAGTAVAGRGTAGLGSGSALGAGDGSGRGANGPAGGTGAGIADARGPGSGKPPAAGSGSGATAATGGTGGTGTGRGSGAGSVREWTIPSPSGPIRVAELADGSRQLTYPRDGNYDVVVLAASLPAEYPRPDEYMTGRPIHTVYLDTGWHRDWVLQYAEPAQKQASNGMVINLGKVEKLTDPYVQMAIVPPDGTLRADSYLLFHGQISREGRFVNVQAGGRVTDDHRRLLAYLNRWIFRPSMKGNRPVDVEMVLVVPPRPVN